jgi:hypothetical protein
MLMLLVVVKTTYEPTIVSVNVDLIFHFLIVCSGIYRQYICLFT